MIDKLAERLGLDRHTLVAVIHAVAGDEAQVSFAQESVEVPGLDMRMLRDVDFGVMIATGSRSAFAISYETDEPGAPGADAVKSITVALR